MTEKLEIFCFYCKLNKALGSRTPPPQQLPDDEARSNRRSIILFSRLQPGACSGSRQTLASGDGEKSLCGDWGGKGSSLAARSGSGDRQSASVQHQVLAAGDGQYPFSCPTGGMREVNFLGRTDRPRGKPSLRASLRDFANEFCIWCCLQSPKLICKV